MTFTQRVRPIALRILFLLGVIGPGLITASAGNDAPGIATYSMAGSFYGYGLLWVLLWAAIGAVVLLEMAARMGATTGKGLTELIRERFGVRVTFLITLGILIANLGTTTAQFAGIAASAELFGFTRHAIVPLVALAVWFLVLRGSYERVERVLLFLTLYAVAYVITTFVVRPPWGEVLRQVMVPSVRLEADYLLALLATVGTTVTPWACAYMQASVADKGVTALEYPYTRFDVILGLMVSSLVAAFIVICAAVTLFANGIRVETATQAAQALAPLAGSWAKQLFGIGLFGASVLAASVLPLATTYAICEVFGWERGIDREVGEAPIFYGLYTLLIVASSIVVLIPGIPLFPLMWLSQVLNAVLLPSVMILMLRLANDPRIMKRQRNSPLTNVLATLLAVVITAATFALLVDAVL
ncbi:MAG: Mn transporter [Anaerolineae bacterium SM23_84]|nr:MAG: Mn transporter [Anaerolineae bacterium SM23_84]